ncbi:MAG: hypothetical protein HDT14_09355 [Oscillibacter sp.]|nr:hypothetical protein [Oscillibacter sp.]
MSDQITLAGFEAPHEKELSAYNSILPRLRIAAEEMGANAEDVKIVPGKTYSSIWYDSLLAFRLRLRKNSRYIEVPVESKDTVSEICPLSDQKEVSGGFWRVKLGAEPVSDHADALAVVLQDTINRLPKEWDCCSRYMECSNARKCVHPDPSFALACGYRKKLVKDIIFYGENRNID